MDEVIDSFVDKGWTLLHVPTDFSRYCIQNNNNRYKPQPKCKDPLTLIACMRRKELVAHLNTVDSLLYVSTLW